MAPSLGVELSPVNVREPSEIERAARGIRALLEWRPDRDGKRGWRRFIAS